MKQLNIFLLVFAISISNAAEIGYLESKPSNHHCCSAEIVELSFGPVEEVENSKDPNRLAWYYRVGIAVSEIYVTLVIEEIAIGEENSRTLVSTRNVSLGTAMVEDVKWVSPASFQFRMNNVRYQLSELQKQKVKLIELKGS